jgi:TolA-binding protein
METQASKSYQLTSKLRLRILTILVVLSIAVLIGFGWISFENRQTASSVEIGSLTVNRSTLEAQLTQQQASLAQKEAQLQDATTRINELNATIITITTQLDEAAATQTAQIQENNLLSASNQSYISTYQQDQTKISELQTKLICDNSGSFKADYHSNYTMADSLKTFIGDMGGNFTSATWDLLWSGSKNSIHKITVFQDNRSFTNIFMVYYDEKDFSTKGVFWINRACWLDR